jgi:tartrate dehydratase alpha subunit/fumarate hydratase class I-like protein
MAQTLVSARMAALGRRPIGPDTGMVTVSARPDQGTRIGGDRAFPDLGMAAVRAMVVEDMPVTAALDSPGAPVRSSGPARWRGVRLPAA